MSKLSKGAPAKFAHQYGTVRINNSSINRISCRSCIHYCEDKSCIKKSLYIPDVGYDSWKYCSEFYPNEVTEENIRTIKRHWSYKLDSYYEATEHTLEPNNSSDEVIEHTLEPYNSCDSLFDVITNMFVIALEHNLHLPKIMGETESEIFEKNIDKDYDYSLFKSYMFLDILAKK